MPDDDYQKTEGKMKDVVEATRKEFASIRTGRANPALLDRVNVEAYGCLLYTSYRGMTEAEEQPNREEVRLWQ